MIKHGLCVPSRRRCRSINLHKCRPTSGLYRNRPDFRKSVSKIPFSWRPFGLRLLTSVIVPMFSDKALYRKNYSIETKFMHQKRWLIYLMSPVIMRMCIFEKPEWTLWVFFFLFETLKNIDIYNFIRRIKLWLLNL